MAGREELFLKKINERQMAAYQMLYSDYYAVLVVYARNFVGQQEIAEDIVQELFITMWEKEMSFLSFASFKAYLYNSVRNTALNYLKHQDVEEKYIEYVQSSYGEIDESEVNDEEVYRLLFKAVDELPARCREIFLMYMDGKKNDEIANMLNLSVETVKTHKKRAVKHIRERLGSLCFTLPVCSILL